MSFQSTANAFLNSSIQFQQIINFGVPTGLNVDTLGTDQETGETSFQPRAPNVINDIVMNPNPGAGLLYSFFTRRQGGTKAFLGNEQRFSTAFTNLPRAGFPRTLGAGFFQWVTQQTLGAATAQSFIVTLAQPLAI